MVHGKRVRRGSPEKEERNAAMVRMRRAGHRYREIGEAFAVSLQRAQKVVRREMERERADG